MTTVVDWPLIVIALAGGAGLGVVLAAALPHRPRRPRSNKQQ